MLTMFKNIIIADDHPVTLSGMKTFLESKGFAVLATCTNGQEALQDILELQPDFALLDLNMPILNGMDLLDKLNQQNCATKIIIYTMHNDFSLFNQAKEKGVNGYLLKEFALEELEECLHVLQTKDFWFSSKLSHTLIRDKNEAVQKKLNELSEIEMQIFNLIGKENSTKEIAELLFLSEKTIENHRTSIISKLNLPKEKNVLLKFAIGYFRK
jgi:DNA-binding NarL/FixJ family response regulator